MKNKPKIIVRVLMGIGIAIVAVPILLITLGIVYEVVGIFANHAATDKQTKELKNVIETEIDDVQITDVYSETGNTTGTSNHVDCLSRITFSSDKDQTFIASSLKKYYYLDEREYYTVTIEGEDGIYVVTQISKAPFPDNIEGH